MHPARKIGLVVAGFLMASGASLQAQALSPDLLALKDMVAELSTLEPPLDPSDQASIVADAQSALSNLSGSTVPYAGKPESLYGARLGMRVANLLYHRFGAPQDAASLLTTVQSVYAAYPPGAPTMSASLGTCQAAASSLPPDFSPSSSASVDNPCVDLDIDEGQLHSDAAALLAPLTVTYEKRIQVEPGVYEWVVVSEPYTPDPCPERMTVLCEMGGDGGAHWLNVRVRSLRNAASSITLRADPEPGGSYQVSPPGY